MEDFESNLDTIPPTREYDGSLIHTASLQEEYEAHDTSEVDQTRDEEDSVVGPSQLEQDATAYDFDETYDEEEFFDDGTMTFSDSEEEAPEILPPDSHIGWTDQVEMMRLRRYLNQLSDLVDDKTHQVNQTRDEMAKCRERIEKLEQERDQVFEEIQDADSQENIPSAQRLRARHRRICQELTNDEELQEKIKSRLEDAEYELSKAQVNQGKLLLAEDELKKKEERLADEKMRMADYRKYKEDEYVDQAIRNKKTNQRAQEWMLAEKRRKQQHALNETRKSKEKTNKYLSRTIAKIRQREVDEEAREKEYMKQRMETMLALKRDIAANRENLKARQARSTAYAHKRKEKENQKIAEILAAGGNPTELLIKQKRLEEFEKEKELFKIKQRERQVEIASGILKEEEQMKKRVIQHPHLFTDSKKEKEKVLAIDCPPNVRLCNPVKKACGEGLKLNAMSTLAMSVRDMIVKPHPEKKLKILEEALYTSRKQEYPIDLDKFEGKTGDESEEEDVGMSSYAVAKETTHIPDSDSDNENSANLAKPEFEGVWDRHKPYKVPKDVDTGLHLPGSSKMEKDIMQKMLGKQRAGIVIKQVAGGKPFKGCAFYSKPTVIHFKDFDVGKTYKKRVVLTNVSYTVNYCKLTGLTEHLKDFIELQFDPPGQMSAGLSCELIVTFKPMINEDLEGEVNFLSQTGPFSIPVKCTIKKCDVKIDKTHVDFGSMVIGETVRRSVTLSNQGALATTFQFTKLTGLRQGTLTSPETSLGRLTSADTNLKGVSPVLEEAAKTSKVDVSKKTSNRKLEEKNGEEKAVEKPTDPNSDETLGESAKEVIDEKDGEEEMLTEAEGSEESRQSTLNMDELINLDGMKLGEITSGEIGPFSTIKLELIWQPTIAGPVESEFVISFADPESKNISVLTSATAVDVPVWLERQTIDLKICMFDRLYQDTILVNNRATTALKLKFEVCKELRNHLELLPKTGYIQAQSQFSAQLKFLPRKSLFEEAGEFFDKDTGVLEAPMTIRVANQTRPVPFTVVAVVTTSDLSFNVENIDFGCCTIYENVTHSVELTNDSILPQQFGFVGIPEYIDVQPNDGFGTILPMETIKLDIIFQPKKAKDYEVELTCKSLINREFKIRCRGIGVHPPLQLSHHVIHYAATALNDVSSASIHVINSHTSMNEFSHPVPRIGTGEIAPVGSTSFEFRVPEGAPINVSPSVGTIEPGKECRIQVSFTPILDETAIRKEAVRLTTKMLQLKAEEEHKAAEIREKESQEQVQKKKGPSKVSPKGKAKGGDNHSVATVKGPAPLQPPKEEDIDPKCDEYAAAQGSLLRQFRGRFQSFVIPCYVASGSCVDGGNLPYSVHNTLFLEVHCPAVKPEIVAISNSGRTTTDFQDVSIGQSIVKSVTLQNISQRTIDLQGSCLDPMGPFSMLNALRMLPPGGSHTMLISFTPLQGQVFQEVLQIKSPNSIFHLTLKGRGVTPIVSLSVKDGMLDFGAVLSGEYRDETFKIVNNSPLGVQYAIRTDSQSLLRHAKAQGLPAFIHTNTKIKSFVGTQNNNGQSVFDCVPAEGRIPAGGSKDITLTFAPDHNSNFYSDAVRIELFGQEEESHMFQVKGEARPHIMYLTGGDTLAPEVESLSVGPIEELDEDAKPPPVTLLATMRSVAKDTEVTMATRDIYVGCVRTMAVSQKKGGGKQNGEWQFDNLQPLAALGFNIDPIKGMIEAGTRKPITISWNPPAGYDPSKSLETSINCTLKGDVTEIYRILIRAQIVTE